MTSLTEFNIIKFKVGTDPHSSGEVIFSKIFNREEFQTKKKAVARLLKKVESYETELVDYKNIGFTISKVPKDADFNDVGVVVYKELFTKEGTSPLRAKAAFRLTKYISKTDKNFDYFAKHVQERIGQYYIISGQRNTELLDKNDKLKTIKRKISARKAVLTRKINEAKKIRLSHSVTLFPDGYLSDPKFKRTLQSVISNKTRLHRTKELKIGDIESIIGGCAETSLFSSSMRLDMLKAA